MRSVAAPTSASASTTSPLLRVDGLTVTFEGRRGSVRAVADVCFSLRRGEVLGLVGESGSGKSLTALALIRLVPPPGRISAGRIEFEGRDLMALDEREMRQVRGARIGFVFQEPMTALSPVYSVGHQISEAIRVHVEASRREAWDRAVALLDDVGIPDPARRADDYPHHLSGGMRQRVMIALALACRPILLIADEPTTALDVTIQAQILDLLRELKTKYDLAVLLITHDLGVVAQTADRAAVMYAGRILEMAPARNLFAAPHHPYTQGLLAAVPSGVSGTRLRAIDGTVPAADGLPPGCAFAPRCPKRFEPCDSAVPALAETAPGRSVRCYLSVNLDA